MNCPSITQESSFPSVIAAFGNIDLTSIGLDNVWSQTAAAIVGCFIVHLIIRGCILKGLDRLAGATDNDLDDRLVHFLRSFYKLILVFVLFLVILRIHGIEVTPLLACAGIAGIALG